MSAFTKMLGFFGQGLYYDENSRVDFVLRYVMESLAEDEIKFFLDCVVQRDKEELYQAFKRIYDAGQLDKNVREFFSFCFDHTTESSDNVSEYGYVVKRWKKYVRIGSMYFDNGNMVDKRNADTWNRAIKRFIGIPDICEVYVDKDKDIPFVIFTVDNAINLIDKVEAIDDFWIVRELFDNVSMIVMVSGGNVRDVVSISSTETGTLRNVSVKCKGIRIFDIPLAILGKSISILSCKTEDGEEISAFVPNTLDNKIATGTTLNFAVYHDTYYLKDEVQ